jgi:hypothetical protein
MGLFLSPHHAVNRGAYAPSARASIAAAVEMFTNRAAACASITGKGELDREEGAVRFTASARCQARGAAHVQPSLGLRSPLAWVLAWPERRAHGP